MLHDASIEFAAGRSRIKQRQWGDQLL